jgi:hypothetical protein
MLRLRSEKNAFAIPGFPDACGGFINTFQSKPRVARLIRSHQCTQAGTAIAGGFFAACSIWGRQARQVRFDYAGDEIAPSSPE